MATSEQLQAWTRLKNFIECELDEMGGNQEEREEMSDYFDEVEKDMNKVEELFILIDDS